MSSTCQVCDGAGFLHAAPVAPIVAFVMWHQAVTIPCWACGGRRTQAAAVTKLVAV